MKEFWAKKHKDEITEMISLKFLGTTAPNPGKPHLVWATTKDNPKETEKAAVKAKLMTGHLQAAVGAEQTIQRTAATHL